MKRKVRIVTNHFKKNVTAFWKYFVENEHEITKCAQVRHLDPELPDMLWEKLESCSTRIGIRFTAGTGNTPHKITFLAYGHKILYHKIDELVRQFPNIPNWTAQALVKPIEDLEPFQNGTDEPYMFEDFSIQVSQLMFVPYDINIERRFMHLKIFLPNYRYHFDNESFPDAVETILQDLLGEEVCYRYLKNFTLAQLPDNPAGLQSIVNLPEFIRDFRYLNKRLKIAI